MYYCTKCGKFFIAGVLKDDGLQDSRFDGSNGNRLFIEVCPECGNCEWENFEELFEDDYIVADRKASIAHICRDEQKIVEGIKLLVEHNIDWDDIVIHKALDVNDGDQFGRII